MRRFLVLALVVLTACGGDNALDPVQTVDGNWTGEDNGVNISLNLTQADTTVAGSALIATLAASAVASVTGTFKYPILHLTITPTTAFQAFTLDGTMSPSEAKLDVTLTGSGLTGTSLGLLKK